jgi:hypothetical protein
LLSILVYEGDRQKRNPPPAPHKYCILYKKALFHSESFFYKDYNVC